MKMNKMKKIIQNLKTEKNEISKKYSEINKKTC